VDAVAGVGGAVAAPMVAGGFRIGAPAADAATGIDTVAAIVVTATKSRRHIEASHGVSRSTIMTTVRVRNRRHARLQLPTAQ
jgi:hypothetical protein